MLAFAALVVAGCAAPPGPKLAPKTPQITQLGSVNVSNGAMSQHDLGEGRVCIIQPTVLPDGTVKLDVMLQNSSKLLAHTRVITPPDKYFEVECDGIRIGMAAHINP